MSIKDSMNKAKKSLDTLRKNHKFKKANKDRQIQVELNYEINKCAGDLGYCKKEYAYTIQEQSKNIREGRAGGFDTVIQEQTLWDSAIGYMLVVDAIYALKTISTYDSVAHAYDLLEAATKKMMGEAPSLFSGFGKKKPKRDEYGYLNSTEAVEEKTRLLETFFDKLILSGDIEACLKEARENQNKQPGLGELGSLDGLEDSGVTSTGISLEDLNARRRSAMFDNTPPKSE